MCIQSKIFTQQPHSIALCTMKERKENARNGGKKMIITIIIICNKGKEEEFITGEEKKNFATNRNYAHKMHASWK